MPKVVSEWKRCENINSFASVVTSSHVLWEDFRENQNCWRVTDWNNWASPQNTGKTSNFDGKLLGMLGISWDHQSARSHTHSVSALDQAMFSPGNPCWQPSVGVMTWIYTALLYIMLTWKIHMLLSPSTSSIFDVEHTWSQHSGTFLVEAVFQYSMARNDASVLNW